MTLITSRSFSTNEGRRLLLLLLLFSCLSAVYLQSLTQEECAPIILLPEKEPFKLTESALGNLPSPRAPISAGKEVLTLVLPARAISVIVFGANFFDFLAHLKRPVRYLTWENFHKADKSTWKSLDNSLIVSFQTTIFGVDPVQYFRHIRSLGVRNVGIFHMADEQCNMSTAYYPMADYVIRNYYCPKVFAKYPSTVWMPNGWADLVGPRPTSSLLPASQRKMDCYFTGRPTPARKHHVEVLKKQGIECVTDFSEGFGLGKPRPVYAFDLAETRFAPCLPGNSPETIRFYDALENGAIPVIAECDFLDMAFPGDSRDNCPPPFIILDSWSHFGEAVRPYLKDKVLLDALQARAVTWWQQQKMVTREDIAKVVDNSFASYGLS